MDSYPDALIPTCRSLLDRLKNWNDRESWESFFHTYWRLIYGVARKAGLTDTEAQEVVQETVIVVARKIPHFSYDPAAGSFKSWLLNTTRWKIADQFRKRIPTQPDPPADPGTATDPSILLQIPDPASVDFESVWDEQWTQNLFDTACDRVKTSVNHKQYQMFDLYCIKGWPVRKVALALDVHPARVYLAKHRISKLIRAEMKRLEQGLPPS
jgi:RNA polymerase sigma factor (sigma-70 family)